jgi:mRNA interferase MazF
VAGRITRGEIRLVRFPAPDKARPVLVLTRDSAIPYLSRVTVAPITSTIRGVPSEVIVGPDEGLKQPCAVNLHNVLTVTRDDIGRRVAQLGDERMREVCRALGFALGCEGS